MPRRQHIFENLIYAIIWLMVFAVPLIGFRSEGAINWMQAQLYWKRIVFFFVLFAVNNYVLVPLFLLKKRKWLYFILTLATIFLLFTVVEPLLFGRGEMPKPPMEHQPAHCDTAPMKPPHDGGPLLRFPIVMGPMLDNWLIAILIIGFNLAVRFLFKSMRDDRQIKELESHTLQAELNYLKAQINPHFFMNTLNNIHALIDIDTDKAKDTVIELSKIMRYVLYEAEQPRVPLAKEIHFLNNYTELMRIRFTKGVEIRTDFPDTVPDTKIPPLLLVTLLENAFKHGISYRQPSFIHTLLTIANGQLTYTVENSVFPDSSPKPAEGLGLENLRKRLSLLYGTNYTLTIERSDNRYKAGLRVPVG